MRSTLHGGLGRRLLLFTLIASASVWLSCSAEQDGSNPADANDDTPVVGDVDIDGVDQASDPVVDTSDPPVDDPRIDTESPDLAADTGRDAADRFDAAEDVRDAVDAELDADALATNLWDVGTWDADVWGP